MADTKQIKIKLVKSQQDCVVKDMRDILMARQRAATALKELDFYIRIYPPFMP